jgi:type VI secretion system protein ImpK
MSDSDNPFGFGRGDRTVIRPNPAGRRPQTPAPPAPSQAPPYPTPPASAPPSYPQPSYPQPSYPQSPQPSYPQPPYYPGQPAAPAPDDWVQTQNRPPPPPQQQQPIRGPLRIDELVAPNENPIMRAAGPLLILLGGLRVAVLRASFASLMEQVAEAIKFFEKDIRSAGIPEEQARTAKYILCATADDIVQNIPTDDRHVWTQYSMLSRFFGERTGGVRFFEELDRAKTDPLGNYAVLELLHACLALGFQGVYRTSSGGQAALQQIQRNLYEILRRVRPRVRYDLSPRWQGQSMVSRIMRVQVPTWAVASVLGVLLLGLFFTLRTLLSGNAEAAAAAFSTLHPDTPVILERRVFVAPPPPPPPPPPRVAHQLTQLQRIRQALASDIRAGKVDAVQTANNIIIRVGNVVLFDSGEADVRKDFNPIARRIGETLNREPGWIKVVGHSDSSPIHTVRFASNFELSVARAKAVADILRPTLRRPDRLRTEGKGADQPIASNKTPEGRAKNRRVEVMIPRAD